MFYNKRKTIGVFLNRAELEFQQVLSRSLTETAKQCDYNIDTQNRKYACRKLVVA